MLHRLKDTLDTLGRFVVFLGEILRSITKKPSRIKRILGEIEHLGVNSVLIILLSGGAM